MFRALGMLLLLLNAAVFANQTEMEFSKFKDFAHSMQDAPLNAMHDFAPKDNIKDYTENPKEEGYYSDVQSQSDNLSSQSISSLKNDTMGSTVYQNFATRERYSINKNSDAIKNAQKIEDESHHIVNGESSEAIDCEKQAEQCKVSQHQEVCYEEKVGDEGYCHYERRVQVDNNSSKRTLTIDAFLNNGFGLRNGFEFDLEEGTAKTVYFPIQNVRFSSLLNDINDCESIAVTVKSLTANGFDYTSQINQQSIPSCQSKTLALNWSWGYGVPAFIQLKVVLSIDIKSTPHVITDSWQGTCELAQKEGCINQSTLCNSPNETRIIDGLAVTKDCWDKTERYLCKESSLEGCQAQKDKGCSQIGSSCKIMQDGVCRRYKQVYQCPVTSCELPIVCTKNVFCADGSCAKTTPSSNENFGKDVAALAAVSEAGEQYAQSDMTLFQGKAFSCKIHTLNFLDCCSNKGWGKKLNLARCSDEDKQLGEAKQKYLVHYLGKYCSKKLPKPLNGCQTRKNTYCVFDSKLARIMQEARLEQLGGQLLGTAERPQCGGMSAEELSSLDMEAIDFVTPIYPLNPSSEGKHLTEAGIAGDLQVTSPSDSSTVDAVSHRIEEKMRDGL